MNRRSAATSGGAEIQKNVTGFLKDNAAMIALLIIVLLLIALFAPQFFSVQNITNVARQASTTGIIAIGMTFVIITGGIDLSVGGVLAATGIVFSILTKFGYELWAAVLCALLLGAIVGIVNGFGAIFFGLPPFIMTLATSSVTGGLALLLCDGIPVEFTTVTSPVIDFFGNGNVGPVPGPFVLFAALAVLSAVVLRYVPFGRYVYSVGSSFEGARLAGVRTTRIIMVTYIVCSVCAALAGIVTACRLYVGHPVAGSTAALDSIAAIVIGGTSLSGGKGSVIGTVVGVLLMTAVANLLNLTGVPTYIQQIVKGVIIILAILLSTKGLKGRIKEAWRGL